MIPVAIVVAMLGSGSVDAAFIPAMDMIVIPLSEEDTICHTGTSRKEYQLQGQSPEGYLPFNGTYRDIHVSLGKLFIL
jgi:hypothetical protein